MTINFYRWNETSPDRRARLMARSQGGLEAVIKAVEPIIHDVRMRGDAALRTHTQTFDKADITDIKVSKQEFDEAENALDEDLKAAIHHCAGNVRRFHQAQMDRVEKPWMVEIQSGVFAGEQVTAIESVGLYVPRGKGAFPSALFMLAIPAVIAGVKNIAIVTPPMADGRTDAATLYTARLCGVEHVYKVGGAQAIAALAYGTKSVPKVKKVLGPGSLYVAAAKRICSDILDAGMPAGPSESIVLADSSAHPYNTCLDILNEAEHGPDSAALLVTHDEALATYVRENLPTMIEGLPEPHRSICTTVMMDKEGGYGGIVLTQSLEESIALANTYAPEHLLLKLRNTDEVLPHIHHAGEILIGEYTPFTLGNYGTGVNHVLPTGGWAHTHSCTSVWDFLKRTSLSRCTKEGLQALTPSVTTMTDYEGFPAHGAALLKRML